jgi:hypothetical protein
MNYKLILILRKNCNFFSRFLHEIYKKIFLFLMRTYNNIYINACAHIYTNEKNN